MTSKRSWTLAWVAMVFLLTTAHAEHLPQPVLQRVADASIRVLDESPGSDRLKLNVQIPTGDVLEVSLEPQTRLLRSATGRLAAVRNGATQVYAGTLVGREAGWARMTRVGDAWVGAIFDGAQIWFLDPARYHRDLAARAGVAVDGTVLYSTSDIEGDADLAGDIAGAVLVPGKGLPTRSQENGWALEYELAVTLVLDTEYQDAYGDDSVSIAVATLNIVDGFYAAQVDTRVMLHHIEVLEDNGNLDTTNYVELLNRFQAFSQDKGLPFRGVSHLLSGKDFDGGTIGYAFLSSACDPTKGYGVDQITVGAAYHATLLAHEIGHNYGAQHDGVVSLVNGITSAMAQQCLDAGGIMAPNMSSTNPATEFTDCSMIWFEQFLATARGCLIPTMPTFADGFEVPLPE